MFKGQPRPWIKALTLKEQDRSHIQNKTPSKGQTKRMFNATVLLCAGGSGPAGHGGQS